MQQNRGRRSFFSIVTPFLIYFGVSFAVSTLASIILIGPKMASIMENPNVDIAKISMELSKEMLSHVTEITAAGALLMIPIFLWMFRRDNKEKALFGVPERNKASIKKYPVIIFFGIVACIGFNNLLILGNTVLFSGYFQDAGASFYKAAFVLQLIGIGIITPIAEELMFRGLIYNRMISMVGVKRALWLSALLFAFYHGNMIQGVYGFIVGYLLAYLYEKYGSMKAPILLHITMNLTSIIMTEADALTWIFKDIMRVGIVTVICAAVGSSLFVFIQSMFKNEEIPEDMDIKVK